MGYSFRAISVIEWLNSRPGANGLLRNTSIDFRTRFYIRDKLCGTPFAVSVLLITAPGGVCGHTAALSAWVFGEGWQVRTASHCSGLRRSMTFIGGTALKKGFAQFAGILCISLAAGCTASPATQHEVACVGGTLTGAVLGGALGNQFGGGRGRTALTAAGAMAGGAIAATQLNC